MTEEEKLVITNLVDAWNNFVALPIQHPTDHAEFYHHIHSLQRVVMSREAVRNNPDLFTDLSKKAE